MKGLEFGAVLASGQGKRLDWRSEGRPLRGWQCSHLGASYLVRLTL